MRSATATGHGGGHGGADGSGAPAGQRPASGRPAMAARWLALAVLLGAAGCATLYGGGSDGETDGGDADRAGEPAADTAAIVTAGGDSVPGAAERLAAEDSVYLALLDSARTLARGGGEPAATPEADTAREDRQEAEEAGDADDDYPAGPVTTTDVEELEAMGPVYTPYRVGPTLTTRAERLDGLLKATLVPVIRRYDLPPDEWARYWLLVDAEGGVRTTVLQLPSGHSSFDEAARAVAESLKFEPARRDDRPVPVWILTRISLLMR